jgi:DNA invertase Pin-like site-specific DNA recombinase
VWLLDLGDCSGNKIRKLMLKVLAAIAQFERTRLAERIIDAKAELRRTRRHQGGTRPFGCRLGAPFVKGRAPTLTPDPKKQAAIAEIVRLRGEGWTLKKIQAPMGARGFPKSHQTIDRRAAIVEAA